MNLNPLARDICHVIGDKGFHDIQHSQLETLTFRQLLHLVTEWSELMGLKHEMTYPTNGRPSDEVLGDFYEEGADIIIVALDLAHLHGVDLSDVPVERTLLGTLNQMFESIPILIGALGDEYRKRRTINADKLAELINVTAHLIKRHGGDPLAEVDRKMARNRARPIRYGTAEVKD